MDGWMTRQEAAQYLRVSTRQLDRLRLPSLNAGRPAALLARGARPAPASPHDGAGRTHEGRPIKAALPVASAQGADRY